MSIRPGQHAPEELRDAPSQGAGVRLYGGGHPEELVEPGVRFVPKGRWLLPVFLAVTFLSALSVLTVTVAAFLRPIHVPVERADDLFHPALVVDGRSWSEPGDLEPDRFLARFCDGMLLPIARSAQAAVMTTGHGEQPGNALTFVFESAEAAASGHARLGAVIDECHARGQRWTRLDVAAGPSGEMTAFRLETPRLRRTPHLLVVRSANTMTMFMTVSAADAEATTAAYRQRVEAVSRAQ